MPIASKYSLPGESPGQKIVRIVRSYVGCSLSNRADELGALVGRGVDDPKRAVTVKTNCGMFALGVYAQAGVDSKVLDRPYLSANGLAPGANAIAWLLELARERAALVTLLQPADIQRKPPPGALLHYATQGKNDDHVEWLLSEVSPGGGAEMGGGGRANNAITSGLGAFVCRNNGRPLRHWIDPNRLGIEVVPAGSDINLAYPDA